MLFTLYTRYYDKQVAVQSSLWLSLMQHVVDSVYYVIFLQDDFFEYLRGIDCSDVEVHAISEGSVVFPKIPLLRVQGPIAVSSML